MSVLDVAGVLLGVAFLGAIWTGYLVPRSVVRKLEEKHRVEPEPYCGWRAAKLADDITVPIEDVIEAAGT